MLPQKIFDFLKLRNAISCILGAVQTKNQLQIRASFTDRISWLQLAYTTLWSAKGISISWYM